MPKLSTRATALNGQSTDYYYMMNASETKDFEIQSQYIFGQDLRPGDNVTFNTIDISNTASSGEYFPINITSGGIANKFGSSIFKHFYIRLTNSVIVAGHVTLASSSGTGSGFYALTLPVSTQIFIPEDVAGTVSSDNGTVEMNSDISLTGYPGNQTDGFSLNINRSSVTSPYTYRLRYVFQYRVE